MGKLAVKGWFVVGFLTAGATFSLSATADPPPVCGRGLTCAGGPTQGATACRQQESSTRSVYCCPTGQRIDNGKCAAPASQAPVCGRGLTCASGPTGGATACRQQESSTTEVFCCPAGQRIANGKCEGLAPVCGRGLYCAGGPTPGATACRQQESSTREVFCCPEGQRIDSGKCVDGRTAEIVSFYTDILHRAPDPKWLAYHVTGGKPTSQVRESIAKTPEARQLVNKAYLAYLGREGEPGGLDSWTNHLARDKSLDWVWEQIRTSEEARRKNGGQPPAATLR